MVTNGFRVARHAITGDSWLDDLARASLSLAEDKFSEELGPLPVLRVSLPGINDLDAHASYVITKAVQDATAKIGHVLTQPKSEVSSVYPRDRERARLLQRGQSGGLIIFGFPVAGSSPDAYLSARVVETLAERAVRELVNILPTSSEDDAALDAVLAQRPTVRNAVNDIVRAVPSRTERLDFQLIRGTGEVIDSVLSADQAMVLKSSLSEAKRVERRVFMTGRLDGVRTKRRIFYLEPDTGNEIHGAIDIEQLEAVRDNLDKQVAVTLLEERFMTVAGTRSRPYYRLISINSPEKLFE